MKIRDSGMPPESLWRDFFEPASILDKLGLTASCGDVVEFGCGYGTFTIPAAAIARGTVHALDIEPEMIEATRCRAAEAGLSNVRAVLRDFVARGTGLDDGSADYAMVFNILHGEEPVALLREALRNLRPGGLAGIMHWNHDPATPRGPAMEIRPRPQQCLRWAQAAGFETPGGAIIDLPPYHYGMVLRRPQR
jgi:SAM-dependent methyltransferase